MKTTFKEALEKLGGCCPVCGNGDHKNMVAGAKKIKEGLEHIFFFCQICGAELSRECNKACIAYILKIVHAGSRKTIKTTALIAFRDTETYLVAGNSEEAEVKSVVRLLTAWNIPLIGPLLKSGNE